MIEYGIDKPFMITFLWRQRNKCGTKEDYETAHDSPYHINTPWGAYGTDKNKDSIGDHLDLSSRTLKAISFALKMLVLVVWIQIAVFISQCSLTRKKKKSKIRTAIS